MRRSAFTFPELINEYSARIVATFVVALAAAYLATGWLVILAFMAGGFIARLLFGPTLSPVAQLTTRWLTPLAERLLSKQGAMVPGPPKRFAQGIGAGLSSVALVTAVSGSAGLAAVLVAMILVAASLESLFGFCLGCVVYARLVRLGVLPEDACLECADITNRVPRGVS